MFYLEYNHTSQKSDIVDIRYDPIPLLTLVQSWALRRGSCCNYV